MRITLKKLEKAKACSRERKRFARLFPNGCELNEKNLRKWAKGKTVEGINASLGWLAVDCLGLDDHAYHVASRRYWTALWGGREPYLVDLISFFKRRVTKRKRRKK